MEPEHLVRVSTFLSLFLQAILNVVLGPSLLYFCSLIKLSLRNFPSDNPPRGTLCTASGVMRSDAAARERTHLLVFRLFH